jgi:hypothetical protein
LGSVAGAEGSAGSASATAAGCVERGTSKLGACGVGSGAAAITPFALGEVVEVATVDVDDSVVGRTAGETPMAAAGETASAVVVAAGLEGRDGAVSGGGVIALGRVVGRGC